MKSSPGKLFIGISVLLAFVSIAVFGLLGSRHTTEMPMENCPYTQNNYSICQNNIDHISKWQQFFNVTLASAALLLSLVAGFFISILNKHAVIDKGRYFYKWKYFLDNKKLYSSPNKIIKWLALFENSPSLAYIRPS